MKTNIKVLALAIAAMAFAVACNNAPAEEEVIDTPVVEEVIDTPAVDTTVVAEEPVEEVAAPAKAAKATTPKQKTVKEVVVEEGEKVAKKAVTTGAEQAANAIDEGKAKKNPFKK